MRRAVIVVLVALASAIAQDQQEKLTITMKDVMTKEEYEKSGVAQLKADQKALLDDWLRRYTMTVFKLALKDVGAPAGKDYAGVRGGHWVKKNIDRGRMVLLEDGSLWDVNGVDHINSTLWLMMDSITVIEAKDAIGEYKYYLINTDQGERVLAKYLGQK